MNRIRESSRCYLLRGAVSWKRPVLACVTGREVPMKLCRAGLLLMPFLAVPTVQSQTPPVAQPSTAAVAATPPMGWNSWDSYGLTITEDQFRANVKVLHNGLMASGYNYAVIDEGWFFFNPLDRPRPDTLVYAIDANGRYVPVPARFPSATASGAPGPASGTWVQPPDTPAPKLNATIQSTSFKPLARLDTRARPQV